MRKIIVFLLIGLCSVGFPTTLYLIFYKAPLQDVLYFNQKIFYYHVPSAFMMFVAIFACGIGSVLYLWKRNPRYDFWAQTGAELAVLFGAIVLMTGSIWGKAAWDVWWQWDARLTSSLLVWVIMVAYVFVRHYGGIGADRLSAGLAIFGMIDVPLIYVSVNIWRTIHPQTSVVPQLEGMMKVTFWISVLLFCAFFSLLFALTMAQRKAMAQMDVIRESALDLGVIE